MTDLEKMALEPLKKAEKQAEKKAQKKEQLIAGFGYAKTINAMAKKVLQTLESKMVDGYAKISNTQGFMAVVVEQIADDKISVAHYYEQNGDLMADPEVVFLKKEFSYGTEYYPIYEKMDGLGLSKELITFDDSGKVEKVFKTQKDTTVFCNVWLKNIKQQQKLLA